MALSGNIYTSSAILTAWYHFYGYLKSPATAKLTSTRKQPDIFPDFNLSELYMTSYH
jgi:hypothetical protein